MKNIGDDEECVCPFPVSRGDMLYLLLWGIFGNNERVYEVMAQSDTLIEQENTIQKIYDIIGEEIIKEIENVPD